MLPPSDVSIAALLSPFRACTTLVSGNACFNYSFASVVCIYRLTAHDLLSPFDVSASVVFGPCCRLSMLASLSSPVPPCFNSSFASLVHLVPLLRCSCHVSCYLVRRCRSAIDAAMFLQPHNSRPFLLESLWSTSK